MWKAEKVRATPFFSTVVQGAGLGSLKDLGFCFVSGSSTELSARRI